MSSLMQTQTMPETFYFRLIPDSDCPIATNLSSWPVTRALLLSFFVAAELNS